MADPAPRFSFFPIILMWVTLAALPLIAWLAASLLYEGLGIDWSRHLDGDLVLVTVALILLYAGYLPITVAAVRSLGARPLIGAPRSVAVGALVLPGVLAFAFYWAQGGIDAPRFDSAVGYTALAVYVLGAVLALVVYLFPIGRER